MCEWCQEEVPAGTVVHRGPFLTSWEPPLALSAALCEEQTLKAASHGIPRKGPEPTDPQWCCASSRSCLPNKLPWGHVHTGPPRDLFPPPESLTGSVWGGPGWAVRTPGWSWCVSRWELLLLSAAAFRKLPAHPTACEHCPGVWAR